MPPSDVSDDPHGVLDDDDDPLFPFGPMPTEPLIAHDRSQAFRFLTYGKGRRCVVTEDYEMMVAVGTTADLKGYVSGWFRAHGTMCRVAITQAPTPGWSQMILALDEDILADRDDEHDAEMELDMGFLEAVDYLDDDDDDFDEDDMMEEFDPDFLPPMEHPMSESDPDAEFTSDSDSDSDSDDDDKESCENCGSKAHTLTQCAGPTDSAGYLRGCPLCDTTSHDLDACPHLDGPRDRRLITRLHARLLVHRRGRAPFYSERMPWTKALLVCLAWGLPCPGPFPWGGEAAARRKGPVEADLEGSEGLEELDPVTGSVEAVEEAIRKGRVPDPGSLEGWLPGGGSPVL